LGGQLVHELVVDRVDARVRHADDRCAVGGWERQVVDRRGFAEAPDGECAHGVRHSQRCVIVDSGTGGEMVMTPSASDMVPRDVDGSTKAGLEGIGLGCCAPLESRWASLR
jgi:hypothetical protein